jgi:hypothetical protein
MEDLVRYLEEIVKPTVADFEQHATSVRHAFLACVATCLAVDYLAHPKKPGNLRRQFARESTDFSIVDDVGHAFKHVITTGNPPRLRAKDVISRPPGSAGQFAIGVSRVGDGMGGVTLQDEKSVDLLEILRRAVDFLHNKVR